jgi:hypothetical protein
MFIFLFSVFIQVKMRIPAISIFLKKLDDDFCASIEVA